MNNIQLLLSQSRPVVMGILNTTPDSFSDGGLFVSAAKATEQALKMIEEGADIIDVGGESTRPGAARVSLDDELQRVMPVIDSIRATSDIVISIDTSKPEVMAAAIQAGADLVNDVNALQAEGAVNICAANKVPVCLMHMQGQPQTMQVNPDYKNIISDVKSFLQNRIHVCLEAGMKKQNIVIDPGFGFGKTVVQNYTLLKHLDDFLGLGCHLLVGISRKSMLANIVGHPPDERVYASVAASVLAYQKGAKIIRVHDVRASVDALKITQAMMDAC